MEQPSKRGKHETSDCRLLFFIGSCAFGGEEQQKIIRLNLSTTDGQLSSAGAPIVVDRANPGWLECRPPSEHLYCAFENDPGEVQAMKVMPHAATLQALGPPVKAVGRHTCCVSLDMTGRWVFTANYTEGSLAVLPVDSDGRLGAATDSKMHQGGDLIPIELHDRQERAHVHQVLPHPSNKWVVVPDLGLSTVFVYAFDETSGGLRGAADDERHLRLLPDAGCRHVAWNESGSILYVNNELDATITVCQFDTCTGKLKPVQTLNTLPEDVVPLRSGHRGNSDIHVHPNGRFVYAGVRTPDPGLIAIFSVSPSNGTLTLTAHESTRGLVPRNFKLCNHGRFLVVGNQETFTVVSFSVDGDTGALTYASTYDTSPHKPCNISNPYFISAT
eukprot:TRINITY_DN46085_c0_g1_i1.p1 TRINITY_DN46085_c0_g1~~TRINITY_DN46085_c0_g1_i1.p1  ORF type:complete len:408 (+),score=33.44 TRINITY_DN46085_c0_g1_i1:62-1225(+)